MYDYLYVLDLLSNRIYEIPVLNSEEIDIDELLEYYNLKSNYCTFMWSTSKLSIETLNPYK